MEIKVMYHDICMPPLQFIGGTKSDWIDVRAITVKINGNTLSWREENKLWYKAGDTVQIDLGFSAELPFGNEGHLLPRSSTFKNYGLILVNSMGVIDESYKGKDDHWIMTYYAVKDGTIERYDRIGQFRVMEKMSLIGPNYLSKVEIIEVKELNNENRGGVGSSGNK